MSLEPNPAGLRLGLQASNARLHERVELCFAQFEGQRGGGDAGKLEEVVDEHAQGACLLAQCRQVVMHVDEAVLDCLVHSFDRCDRRAEIVTCGCDELSSSLEELLDIRCHL